ncbi:hypothetical protein B0H13DRAFT_1861359 [Mycena leptocephala]|nr:hypothetical protein B0H13DRAFT_1861359 [Mycena leptocephala]
MPRPMPSPRGVTFTSSSPPPFHLHPCGHAKYMAGECFFNGDALDWSSSSLRPTLARHGSIERHFEMDERAEAGTTLDARHIRSGQETERAAISERNTASGWRRSPGEDDVARVTADRAAAGGEYNTANPQSVNFGTQLTRERG